MNFVSFFCRETDTFVGKKWRQVVVGDILKVGCDEMFPADLLLLQSSDISGSCHVSTANLDGENNLKQKQLPRGFVDVSSLSLKAPTPQDGQTHSNKPSASANDHFVEFGG